MKAELQKRKFRELWDSRNPQHEINYDTGKDMFYDTAFMVCEEYSQLQNKELIEENKDLKITIEGLQMEVNDLQAEI